jgi:hypothetical protein
MPNYIKSGKYYYEVNKRDGKKLRISKDKYAKMSNKKVVRKSKTVNKKVNQKVNIKNDELNVAKMIKDKLKNMDKNRALENLIRLHFDTKKGSKLYHVDAELGRCPRTGYYIYKVEVQHIPENGMNQINAYSSHMVSSNKELLKDLL